MNKEASYRNLGGINVEGSKYTTDITEFLDLRNFGFVRPGSLTSRYGQETIVAFSSSTLLVKPTTQIEYIQSTGATYVLYDSGQTLYLYPTTAVGTSLTPSPTLGQTIDYVVQNDWLFYGNGSVWHRFGGTVSVHYASGNIRANYNGYASYGCTFNTSLTPTDGVTSVIPPGTYYFYLTPARGPQSLITQYGVPGGFDYAVEPYISQISDGFGGRASFSATIVAMGRWQVYGFTVLAGHGYSNAAVEYQKSTSLSFNAKGQITNLLKSSMSYSWATSTFGGAVTVFGIVFDHYTLSASWENQYRITTVPRYLETYNNMLFACGFSTTPMRVLFSEIGEPERIKEENFFDIRTKDNSPITGCIFYQDSLLFFKKRSIFELVGTSPTDLSLRTINLEYGSINNECLVVFQNKLWFVDAEMGICEYNAANIKVVSEPIQDYLDQVDLSKIKAIHYKDRSEVWFCADNLCFVYDYFSNAWSIFDNIPIDRTSGAVVLPNGSNNDLYYFRTDGGFHQRARFGQSLTSDFGQNITLIAKSRFHKFEGDSSQKLFRRLFVDSESATVLGATINFRQDYGSSIVASVGMTMVQFQERIDFGISARAVSVEMIVKSGLSYTVNGYTIESRLLRNV